MGMAGGGVNALRGHSIFEGTADLGLLSQKSAGLPDAASENRPTCKTYLAANTPAIVEGSGQLLGQLSEILRLNDEGLLW